MTDEPLSSTPLVCTCRHPDLERLHWWQATQCRRCLRAVFAPSMLAPGSTGTAGAAIDPQAGEARVPSSATVAPTLPRPQGVVAVPPERAQPHPAPSGGTPPQGGDAVSRHLVWFSAGAASAVDAKLTVNEHPNAVVAYVDPGSEHIDNRRFISAVSVWLDHDIVTLHPYPYRDTWEVWNARRFLVGPHGAPCTIELKKKVRFAFQQPDDIQVFGYTAEEAHRAERFRELNPEVALSCPLIDRGLTKADCLAIIDRAGIELPAMYRLGFRNNNCIGCPKGGIGYWNHIRRHFYPVFDRMAKLERDIGHSVLKDADGPVWLDELDPERGDLLGEPSIDCSLLCALAEEEVAPTRKQGDTP